MKTVPVSHTNLQRYGEDDYLLAKQHDIPWVMSTDENGIYTLGEWDWELMCGM
jgi:isoleucyl-tRNA synthetase